MKKTLLVLLVLCATGFVFAQTPFTATYTFGADGNVQSFGYNGTNYPAITMSNIDKVGVTTSSSSNNFRATGWPTSASPDAGKYIGFIMTAAAGYKFTVTTINFGIGRSGTGTRDTEWRGSADSYAALINNYTTLDSNLTNNSGVLNNPDANSNWTGNILTLGASYANIATSCGFRVYLYTTEAASGTAGLAGPITISGTFETTAPVPSLSVDPSILNGFTYVFGNGPSQELSFDLTGTNLTGDVNVSSVGTNYEIASTSGGTYGSSLSFTPAGGSVSATVYVQLKAGLAIDSYNSETITCSSTGATSQTVTCSGTVSTPPPPVAPVATDETSVTENGFTATWTPVAGATGYYLDVYTGNQTDVLNTSFEGSTSFPDGWTQNSSYVQNNAVGAHTGTNYAGMNALNDYFYTPQLINPTTISFWVLASSATANNTTIVQYSSDATTWTDLASYSANGSDTGDVTTTFSQKVINANLTGSYYIRWFMSARSGGSQYFDDVLITSGTSTYILDNADVSNVTSYAVTGLDASTTYYYVVRAYNDYGTSGNSNEIEVTTDGGTVPVELSSFTATMTNDLNVQLTWITQSEDNMNGFYVRRATVNELGQTQLVSPLIQATNTSTMQTYTFVDREDLMDGTYYYWLEEVEMDGTVAYFGPITLAYSTNSTTPPVIPAVTALKAVFPNPFNPTAVIPYTLAESRDVTIHIYNTRGQIIRSFRQGTQPANSYKIVWDGTDANGNALGTGVYYIKMLAGKDSFQQKAVLIK